MKVTEQFNKVKNTAKRKAATVTKTTIRWVRRVLIAAAVVTTLAAGLTAYVTHSSVPHAHNVYSAAKLIDGEARGESYEGQKAVFATLLIRKEHKQFPDTFHGVAYQPYSRNNKLLQYNAMGDHLHEDLSTKLGQTILLRTAWWYVQAQLGIFVAPKEAHNAHSYCVPSACERQKGYFGTLKRVGQIGNHVFYADCNEEDEVVMAQAKQLAPKTSLRPKLRPTRSAAPTSSLRPKLRPANLQVTARTDAVMKQLLSQ